MPTAPILIALAPSHCDAFLDYIDDFRRTGESEYVEDTITTQLFAHYAERLRQEAAGIDLARGIVPASTWFLWDGRLILGRTAIRHRLTPNLEDFGGHIGYDVRPSQRGRGYGSLLLALALVKAHQLGLKRVLITCSPDNIPSMCIIQRNGGQLASQSPAITADNRLTQRYWIDIARRSGLARTCISRADKGADPRPTQMRRGRPRPTHAGATMQPSAPCRCADRRGYPSVESTPLCHRGPSRWDSRRGGALR
jgi:predicted acetyltransferase